MRGRVEAWLQRTWYREQSPPFPLRLLESIYEKGLAHDRQRRGAHPARASLPLITVGNLTAGGTGKTPLVMHIVQLLQSAGLRPGVVSRGYGRRDQGTRLVAPDTPVSLAGDEALLMSRNTGVPVVVTAQRLAGIESLAGEVDLVVLDDGLQDWGLAQDIRICVIDGARGFGNGHLLPAGPMREPTSGLARMDHLVVNGSEAQCDEWPDAWCMQMIPAPLVNLADPERTLPLAQLQGRAVTAMAGIGHPQRFFSLLEQLGAQVTPLPLPDHHDYSAGLPVDIKGMLVTTAKDAVKLNAEQMADDAWLLPVAAQLDSAFSSRLLEQVRSLPGCSGQAEPQPERI